MKKILYVIDIFNIGGATDYLLFLASEFSSNQVINIACNKNLRINYSKTTENNINVFNSEELFDFYSTNKFEQIHWFKSQSTGFFDEFCKEMNKHKVFIPIIITVCQSPKKFEYRITPNEVKYCRFIVFIDNNSFSCKSNKHIHEFQKTMIYFGTKWPEKSEFLNNEKDYILFGRGSSLNKCHRNLVEWYNSIDCDNKKFCIAGIPENTEWINNEIKKYNLTESIRIVSHLPINEWYNLVNSFDVFLYQIPLNSYSSIDGTLQAAMFFSKPIVYYGPESPKELIVHGKSGFIAKNKDEFISYATTLASNKDLRLKVGSEGRKQLLENFSWSGTVNKYSHLYNEIDIFSLNPIKPATIYTLQYKFSEILYQIKLFIFSIYKHLKLIFKK